METWPKRPVVVVDVVAAVDAVIVVRVARVLPAAIHRCWLNFRVLVHAAAVVGRVVADAAVSFFGKKKFFFVWISGCGGRRKREAAQIQALFPRTNFANKAFDPTAVAFNCDIDLKHLKNLKTSCPNNCQADETSTPLRKAIQKAALAIRPKRNTAVYIPVGGAGKSTFSGGATTSGEELAPRFRLSASIGGTAADRWKAEEIIMRFYGIA